MFALFQLVLTRLRTAPRYQVTGLTRSFWPERPSRTFPMWPSTSEPLAIIRCKESAPWLAMQHQPCERLKTTKTQATTGDCVFASTFNQATRNTSTGRHTLLDPFRNSARFPSLEASPKDDRPISVDRDKKVFFNRHQGRTA